MVFNGPPPSTVEVWPSQSEYLTNRRYYPRCRTRQDYIDKFHKLTNKTDGGCWLWQGSSTNKDRGARGIYHFDGRLWGFGVIRPWPIGRFAWLITHGEQPPKDLFVCHTCDNGLCCNPDHLFLGTPSDNMQDMLAKGRGAWQDPNLPITRKDFLRLNFSISTGKRYVIQEIRRIYVEEGWSIAALGRRFGYEQSSIFRMLDGSRHGFPPIETDKQNRTVTL